MPLPRRQIGVAEAASLRRLHRRPEHHFQIRHKPWTIAPFMIAPVLPGETMQNLRMQFSAVSAPVKSNLLGAHLEHYFFYVKLNDLENRVAIIERMKTLQNISSDDVTQSDPGVDWSGQVKTTPYYYAATTECDDADFTPGAAPASKTVPWLQACTRAIVKEFFRLPEEWPAAEPTDQVPTVDDFHIASIIRDNWLDSIEPASMVPDAVNLDVDLNADNTITMDELKRAERLWKLMEDLGRTNEWTYEEFLATFGVRIPREELHRPELLRYSREFSKPAVHVDPSTGGASSAFVFGGGLRADKKRFFQQHGFVVGLSCLRPKVYLGKIRQSAVNRLLITAESWLPALLADDPATSQVLLNDPTALLSDTSFAHTLDAGDCDASVPVWVDVADLYRYGDQLINFSLSETNAGLVALPVKITDAVNKRYVSSTDINGLFTGSTDATRVIAQEGVVSLVVSGLVSDSSATSPSDRVP